MAICEKCWAAAFRRSKNNPSKSQTEHYLDIIKERTGDGCTPEEQAGTTNETED